MGPDIPYTPLREQTHTSEKLPSGNIVWGDKMLFIKNQLSANLWMRCHVINNIISNKKHDIWADNRKKFYEIWL